MGFNVKKFLTSCLGDFDAYTLTSVNRDADDQNSYELYLLRVSSPFEEGAEELINLTVRWSASAHTLTLMTWVLTSEYGIENESDLTEFIDSRHETSQAIFTFISHEHVAQLISRLDSDSAAPLLGSIKIRIGIPVPKKWRKKPKRLRPFFYECIRQLLEEAEDAGSFEVLEEALYDSEAPPPKPLLN